ncbi:hypothetical protein H6G00_01720 [Leptolyngbya sp. FACHB-541]|uniref:hypothetical protein n=1 Tax=Leptolyngbya sp. FACHB-541 TaxID=2692810 RepID=UPI0016894635|nr:hypothetical protein [Leptolyngbya sp. FACHB-541]MBD1995349.1 hypothetical protein [Leptolyngbya sp. FACHB-541]
MPSIPESPIKFEMSSNLFLYQVEREGLRDASGSYYKILDSDVEPGDKVLHKWIFVVDTGYIIQGDGAPLITGKIATLGSRKHLTITGVEEEFSFADSVRMFLNKKDSETFTTCAVHDGEPIRIYLAWSRSSGWELTTKKQYDACYGLGPQFQ